MNGAFFKLNNMNKNYFALLFCVFVAIVMSACSSKNDKIVYHIYSSADTIKVNEMVNGYMTDLQSKDYESAINRLKVLQGPKVIDLTEEQRNELISYYKQMPVLRYKLVDMLWNDRDLINFKYNVEFFDVPEGENMPNTYKINLVPVRINDVWYLTLGGRN